MHSFAAPNAASDDGQSSWEHYVDPGQRIEMEVPAQWIRQPSAGYLLDLHAPDDPWTALQLSFHLLHKLRFGERVNELLVEDSERWALQRRASHIHNGNAAIEADFSLQSNGASWLMRKLFVPHGDGVFVLTFMTRLATWSRYGAIHRGVYRTLSMCSTLPQPKMRVVPERTLSPGIHRDGPLLLL